MEPGKQLSNKKVKIDPALLMRGFRAGALSGGVMAGVGIVGYLSAENLIEGYLQAMTGGSIVGGIAGYVLYKRSGAHKSKAIYKAFKSGIYAGGYGSLVIFALSAIGTALVSRK